MEGPLSPDTRLNYRLSGVSVAPYYRKHYDVEDITLGISRMRVDTPTAKNPVSTIVFKTKTDVVYHLSNSDHVPKSNSPASLFVTYARPCKSCFPEAVLYCSSLHAKKFHLLNCKNAPVRCFAEHPKAAWEICGRKLADCCKNIDTTPQLPK